LIYQDYRAYGQNDFENDPEKKNKQLNTNSISLKLNLMRKKKRMRAVVLKCGAIYANLMKRGPTHLLNKGHHGKSKHGISDSPAETRKQPTVQLRRGSGSQSRHELDRLLTTWPVGFTKKSCDDIVR
jgi:hypothetical protein